MERKRDLQWIIPCTAHTMLLKKVHSIFPRFIEQWWIINVIYSFVHQIHSMPTNGFLFSLCFALLYLALWHGKFNMRIKCIQCSVTHFIWVLRIYKYICINDAEPNAHCNLFQSLHSIYLVFIISVWILTLIGNHYDFLILYTTRQREYIYVWKWSTNDCISVWFEEAVLFFFSVCLVFRLYFSLLHILFPYEFGAKSLAIFHAFDVHDHV